MFRIYRSNRKRFAWVENSKKYAPTDNSYFQYFYTLKDAKTAAKKKDKWDCIAVQIEQCIDDRWFPVQ